MVLEGKKGTYIIDKIKLNGYIGSDSRVRKYIGEIKKKSTSKIAKKEIKRKDIISLL